MFNYIRLLIFIPFAVCGTASCSDEEDDNCTSALCPFVGNWQLSEVIIDGGPGGEDYSGYRLNLMSPEGQELTADYTRAFGNGQNEGGTWTVTNNNDVIVLSTGGEEDEYIVQESASNKLVLVLHRESIKPGPAEIIYAFTR